MQKHKCKLCSKSFCNGRALGGHMKSHLVSSSHTPIRKKLGDSVDSSSSSSSDGYKTLVYGLRENPRKSCRVVNPDPESSSVYNSETETELRRADVSKKKKKKTNKRSKKRVSRKKQKTSHGNSNESQGPASSVSDGSPEQDLAMWLMMLSRDTREVDMKKPGKLHFQELRRCVIDLNLPPPQESDIFITVV